MSVTVKINNDNSQEQRKLNVFFFVIGNRTEQILICCGAVFVFYILYGYMQELIFRLDGFEKFGWFLTLVQFGYYTIFGLIENFFRHLTTRRIPLQMYFLLALFTIGSMGFSNASVGYLNYPTQVIFKCCKLIPVLIGSILIQGKRYGVLDFGAASLMSIGLILFTLADSQVSPNFNINGIIMILIALICDAALGNFQEKLMKTYNATNAEIVFYSYAVGFVYIFFLMLLSGNLLDGLSFFAKHPKETYGYGLIFSITGYLGVQVVLMLVRTCGAFAAVTVTTCRKTITIILSFIFFSKPFTVQFLWSGILVVLGIYLNLFSKKHTISLLNIKSKIIYYYQYIKLKFCKKQYHYQFLTDV